MTNAVAVAVGSNGVVYVVGTVQRHGCEGGGWFIRSYGPNGRFLNMGAPQKRLVLPAAGPADGPGCRGARQHGRRGRGRHGLLR